MTILSGSGVEALQRRGAGGEGIGFEAEVLQVGDEEVGEGGSLAVLGIEGEVLAVLEASARRDHGEVGVVVTGGVAEVGTAQDGGLVEQGMVAFAHLVEFGEKAGKEAHFLEFDEGQLFDFSLIPAMVTEVVPVFVDSLQGGDIVSSRAAEGHQARRIGAEGEEDEFVHQLHVADEISAVLNVGDGFTIDLGLGKGGPLLLSDETLFQFAHAGEVLIEGLMVFAAEFPRQGGRLVSDEVHDALPVFEVTHVGGLFAGVSFEKKGGEEAGGAGFRGDAHARASVAQARVVGGQREEGEAGKVADALGGVLVNRDRVLEAGLTRMGRTGEETFFGGVSAIDIGMVKSGNDGELLAVRLQRFEVAGDLVVAAGFLRKEEGRVDAEGRANGQHASDVRFLFGRGSPD